MGVLERWLSMRMGAGVPRHPLKWWVGITACLESHPQKAETEHLPPHPFPSPDPRNLAREISLPGTAFGGASLPRDLRRSVALLWKTGPAEPRKPAEGVTLVLTSKTPSLDWPMPWVKKP